MKNRAIFLSLLLLFLSNLALPQTAETQESLKEDLDTYVGIFEHMDLESMLEYMPPKFFDKIPKDAMLQVLEQSFNNPDVSIAMDSFHVLKIHPILNLETGMYTLVDYGFTMYMSVKKNLDEGETDEDFLEQMSFTKSMLEMQHGEGSVVYEEASNTFQIAVQTTMYAISEPEFEGWKFIEKKEKMAGLLESVMPKEAIEGLN